ncbi:MAG TPA: transposase [Alphaproteobacteria bacterium]|nr:transposase [Alphaproteobacteria bacterium]
MSDEPWERIRDHVPEEHLPEGRPGRTPVPARAVLEAVLWRLNTGAHWPRLPQCSSNDKTVPRPFQPWCERAVRREILKDLANTLRDEATVDERESFIDATVVAAKGGGDAVGLTKRGIGMGSRSRSGRTLRIIMRLRWCN